MSTWIPIAISALTALLTLLLYIHERRDRRADMAEERRDRSADMAEERRLRDEEVRLLRQQVEIQVEDRAEQRAAYVSAIQGRSSGGATRDSYAFKVANAGPAIARHVEIELHDAATKKTVVQGKVDPWILSVGETGEAVVELPREYRGKELLVVAVWADPGHGTASRRSRDIGPLDHVSTVA